MSKFRNPFTVTNPPTVGPDRLREERDAYIVAEARRQSTGWTVRAQEDAKKRNSITIADARPKIDSILGPVVVGERHLTERENPTKLKNFYYQLSQTKNGYRFYPGAWLDGPVYSGPGSTISSTDQQRYSFFSDEYTVFRTGASAVDYAQQADWRIKNSVPDFRKVFNPKYEEYENTIIVMDRSIKDSNSVSAAALDRIQTLQTELFKLKNDVERWAESPLVKDSIYYWQSGQAADKKVIQQTKEIIARNDAALRSKQIPLVSDPEQYLNQVSLIKTPEPGQSVTLINRPDLPPLRRPRAAAQRPIPPLRQPRRGR